MDEDLVADLPRGFHSAIHTPSAVSAMADPDIDVAIIGGGIIGVMTALGLLKRGMRVTIYERAQSWHEMGVGFAFTGIARQCMDRLNPSVLEALRAVSEENKHDYNRYWDGFSPRTTEDGNDSEKSLLFKVPARDAAYWGCLRSRFLQEMANKLPEGTTVFEKQLITYDDSADADKVVLDFADGEKVKADIVIGCDGINSTTRQILLGKDSPASRPGYSHNVAYRTVLPVEEAAAAFGDHKSNNPCMHLGPDAVVVSYPVNQGKLLNVSTFVHDPNEWPDANKTTAPGTRKELQEVMKDWSPQVRQLVDVLPEQMTKWAIFDTADHPAPTYAAGRVCIAGDAAHASSPLLGAGACMGVEDALVLAESLELAVHNNLFKTNRSKAISGALQSYSNVRKERTQWLVRSSREAGEIYQWRLPEAGRDAGKCEEEFAKRARKIWDFDISKMSEEAKTTCLSLLAGGN